MSAGSGKHTNSGTITLAANLTVTESGSGSFTASVSEASSTGSVDSGAATVT